MDGASDRAFNDKVNFCIDYLSETLCSIIFNGNSVKFCSLQLDNKWLINAGGKLQMLDHAF